MHLSPHNYVFGRTGLKSPNFLNRGEKQLIKLIETWTKTLLQVADLKTWSNSGNVATSMGDTVQNLINLKKNKINQLIKLQATHS